MDLGNLLDRSFLHHWAAGASQRTVGGDVDSFCLTEIYNLLLWERWVVLDLVDSWDNGGLGKQLLQEGYAVVANTDSLGLACS